MAASMARSGLRFLRRGSNTSSNPFSAANNKKNFSASAHHDDAYETAKWEKITYAGIVTCTILAIYNLSKGHPHHDEQPAYPYLHIRNKEFPWVNLLKFQVIRRQEEIQSIANRMAIPPEGIQRAALWLLELKLNDLEVRAVYMPTGDTPSIANSCYRDEFENDSWRVDGRS